MLSHGLLVTRNHKKFFFPSKSPSDLVLIFRGSYFLKKKNPPFSCLFYTNTPFPRSAQAHTLSQPCPFRASDPVLPLGYNSFPLKPSLLFHFSHLSLSMMHKPRAAYCLWNLLISSSKPSKVKTQPNVCCFMRALFFSAGWYEGERLRDGERGWFPMECAKEITCQATIDKNVERMGRLLGLETNV